MLKILFRQPVHIFYALRARHKLEIFFLLLTVGAVATTRSASLLKLYMHNHPSPSTLLFVLLNVQLLATGFSLLFVLLHLLPGQKGLRALAFHPLDKQALFQLYGYYAFKYGVLFWITGFIITLALLPAWSLALRHLLLFVLLEGAISVLLVILRIRFGDNRSFGSAGGITLVVYGLAMAGVYLFSPVLLPFLIGSIPVFTFLTGWIYKKLPPAPLLLQDRRRSAIKINWQKNYLRRVPRLFPDVLQALWEKELRLRWRNPLYRRIKIKLLMLFIAGLTLILSLPVSHKPAALQIWIALIFWRHFSAGFNEKFMPGENDWFVRTQPLRFHHYFMARYLSEVPFLGALYFFSAAALLFSGLSGIDYLAALGLMLIVGQLILIFMLNFQALFYDDARLAGYAFHFSVIFSGIMIINARLVGPVVILGLVIYNFYKTRQYFSE